MTEHTMITLHKASEFLFSVDIAGEPIGNIELYTNLFHAQNQYLRLHLREYETKWAADLFSRIRETAGRPLQVMLSSEDNMQVDFLTAGGFVCRRKCYELEVTANDLVSPLSAAEVKITEPGQPEYSICARLLYDYYAGTHAGINPLTVGSATFCQDLPVRAFYCMADEMIRHFAFVEGNEIAYIGSVSVGDIRPFAEAVVSKLLSEYTAICFECDDCDDAAMTLKNLFSVDLRESYNTYVRE